MTKAQGTGGAGFDQILLEMRMEFAASEERDKRLEAKVDSSMQSLETRIDAKFEKFMGLVVDEFAEVDRRFDAVDKRFENVYGHLDRIEGKLDKMDTRVSAL